MKMYTTLMAAYGAGAGINDKFWRRRRQHAPRTQAEKGPGVAERIVNCMSFIFVPFSFLSFFSEGQGNLKGKGWG
jgi:hypothetical protein